MLGLIKRQKIPANWQWVVAGKHPAAKDFFTLGEESLIVEALIEWIRRGAERVVSDKKEYLTRSCSWCFWTKTPHEGVLVCGVVRNSCDSIGRPFPLLVMGTGPLKGWEDNWDLLPLSCERIWVQMEQVARKTYSALENLQGDIEMFRSPLPGWQELVSTRDRLIEKGECVTAQQLPLLSTGVPQELFWSLRMDKVEDPLTKINQINLLLRPGVQQVPNALFIGGPMENTGLVFLQRPLSGSDFEQMWIPEAGTFNEVSLV